MILHHKKKSNETISRRDEALSKEQCNSQKNRKTMTSYTLLHSRFSLLGLMSASFSYVLTG